jgi:hypothetical protein
MLPGAARALDMTRQHRLVSSTAPMRRASQVSEGGASATRAGHAEQTGGRGSRFAQSRGGG